MLPHGTMLAMTNNNVPALHVVSIPWNVYGTGYETHDTEEYTTEDTADNFKALARRNGIKVSSPGKETDEICGATANLSPSATEFVPRYAAAPEVLPENLQLATFPQTSLSKTATSPMNEDKKLLAMFQEVLNEKKQQFKILEDCMKEREESKSTISSLAEAKTALKEEVEKLTCDLMKRKERNSMLSEEVEALAERLIESEENNTRLKSQVTTLTNRLQETENGQESLQKHIIEQSERTMVTSLFNKLNESEGEKERAWNVVEGLSNKYDMLLKDNERKETDLITLKEQLEQVIMDKACAETKATMLEDELRQNKFDKDRVEAEMFNLICELKEYRYEKEREKETRIKEVNHTTAATLSSEKNTSLEKKMDSLDNINALDDDDQNWTVVQKKTKGAKSTKTSHPYKSQSSDKKVKAKRSQSLDDTILGINNGVCSADKKYPQKEEKVISPLMPENWEHTDSQHSNVHSGLASKPQKVAQKSSVNADVQRKSSVNADVQRKSYVNAEVPRKSSITAEVETPEIHDTVTPTTFEVNSDSLNTARHFSSAPPVKEPTKQVKPGKQVTTSIESSQSFTSTTKTTTTTETCISEKINIFPANSIHQTPSDPNTSVDSVLTKLDSLTEQLALGKLSSTLPNGTEGCFAHPLFDPAVIDMSILQTYTQPYGQNIPAPGLKTNPPSFTCGPTSGSSHLNSRSKDHTKLSTRQEKDKAKQNLSSFDILMNQLTEKFPSQTRNELMVLLKLAKTTFGDQGFRKKKIEEIVKRVGEIIVPENIDNTEKSAQICSICREEMENETVLECGHAFHGKCVNEWIQTERTCPLCRSHALTEDDFPTLA